MKIAVHQPQFMPWLGYFDKMDKVDIFVLLDTVQFKKNEYQNRNRIKNSKNWEWLTVPVMFHFGDRISEVAIDNKSDWRKKHLHTLQTNYGKADFFREYQPAFEALYEKPYENMSLLNIDTIMLLREMLSIKTEVVVASALPPMSEEPTERLLDICRHFHADAYVAGAGGKGYMECERFRDAGIKLMFQHFIHPEYGQLYGAFEPFMSALDLIFNAGGDFDIVRSMNNELEEA
jgi:hypothetical protein